MSATLIAAVDTYYDYVVRQLAIVNAARQFGGVTNARQWPMMSPKSGWLYLLFLKERQLFGSPLKAGGVPSSRASLLIEYFCQWVWVLAGPDLTPAQIGENRISYRDDFQIREELRQANFPGWCSKKTYSADSQGVVTSAVVENETIWWGTAGGQTRSDVTTGLTFGSDALSILAYSVVSDLVA